ncbi:hypothetical protein [Hymenobacter sp. BT18]|uniref:hypothetical protein n=1 Tax=Hymenobacter sp. BT18 TaxID=2835648 RepID=UPI001E282AD8|nr:hypothetical protein [Hymenobacter sp. BT18]
MRRLLPALQNPFELDLRALALLRIGTGAVVLTDLIIRSTDLVAHYTNLGVLPLHVLYQYGWNPYVFSLHTSSGLWQVQALLFALAALTAAALVLGYKTRWATAISWLLLISLQNRNPLIVQGGDDLLRMLLFWGFFLPWGRVYSLDSRKQAAPSSYRYFSMVTVAYVVQLALVYWCTALLKNSPEWTQDGTAIYYALSLDQILMPLGRLLYPHAELLRGLTFLTYYTELLLPFLLFLPFRITWWRLLFVGVLYAFHLGISLTLFVGLFYLINMASVLGLLPAHVLGKLAAWLHPRWAQLAARTHTWRRSWVTWLPVRINVHVQWYPGSRRLLRAGREAAVGALLVYICWWNLDTLPQFRWKMTEPMRWFGYMFRVDQRWGMFAPAVFKDDGWFILDGTTTAGQHLDLNREGQPVEATKPASVVALFKNDRWRKYSENYLFVANSYMRPYYCNYLLRIWHENPAHPPLRQLEVVYMKEVTLPNYRVAPPVREVLCTCAPAPRP